MNNKVAWVSSWGARMKLWNFLLKAIYRSKTIKFHPAELESVLKRGRAERDEEAGNSKKQNFHSWHIFLMIEFVYEMSIGGEEIKFNFFTVSNWDREEVRREMRLSKRRRRRDKLSCSSDWLTLKEFKVEEFSSHLHLDDFSLRRLNLILLTGLSWQQHEAQIKFISILRGVIRWSKDEKICSSIYNYIEILDRSDFLGTRTRNSHRN